MNKEMIERCARAAYEKFNENLIPELEPFWLDLEASFKERMIEAQIAAIKAMREPTETQYNALCATNLTWRELNSHKVWTTYVDAITGAE